MYSFTIHVHTSNQQFKFMITPPYFCSSYISHLAHNFLTSNLFFNGESCTTSNIYYIMDLYFLCYNIPLIFFLYFDFSYFLIFINALQPQFSNLFLNSPTYFLNISFTFFTIFISFTMQCHIFEYFMLHIHFIWHHHRH